MFSIDDLALSFLAGSIVALLVRGFMHGFFNSEGDIMYGYYHNSTIEPKKECDKPKQQEELAECVKCSSVIFLKSAKIVYVFSYVTESSYKIYCKKCAPPYDKETLFPEAGKFRYYAKFNFDYLEVTKDGKIIDDRIKNKL